MRIVEIFQSIDGEVNHWGQGTRTTFIRFAGCSLHCKYCDTKISQNVNAGRDMSVEEIIKEIIKLKIHKITITGGEPLLQDHDDLEELCKRIITLNAVITIETNGTVPIKRIKGAGGFFISYIVDYKLDYENKMRVDFTKLTQYDIVKIPICSRGDFVRAMFLYNDFLYWDVFCKNGTRIAMSPIGIEPKQLLQWLDDEEEDNQIVLNVQLHKLLDLR